MGFFGTYLHENGTWRHDVPPGRNEVWQPVRGDGPPEATEPWLLVDIHDSDITIVTYRPAGPGSGTAYLGFTPRSYFERDDASAPTDVDREAAGLAAWWRGLHAATAEGATTEGAAAKQAELAGYLARDLAPEDIDGLDDELDEDAFDEDAVFVEEDYFVEYRTSRFLAALGLPLPDGLPSA